MEFIILTFPLLDCIKHSHFLADTLFLDVARLDALDIRVVHLDRDGAGSFVDDEERGWCPSFELKR